MSIIIILNFKDGNTDGALDHLYPEMFRDTPKTWHQYVRMTVFKSVEFTQHNYTNIRKFNFEIFIW